MNDATCPEECSSLGVDALALTRYRSVEADDVWIVYDLDVEDAWIQSDVSFAREACI